MRNLSRPAPGSTPTIDQYGRRRLWFTTSLVSTAALAAFVVMGSVTTQGSVTVATVNAGQAVRSSDIMELATRPTSDLGTAPLFAGSIAPLDLAIPTVAVPAALTAAAKEPPVDAPPPLRALRSEEPDLVTVASTDPAAIAEPDTASRPIADANPASGAFAALQSVRRVDKPTVVGGHRRPLRMASLGTAPNETLLVKRSPAALPPRLEEHTIIVAEGDTLYNILDRYGVRTAEAVDLIRSLASVFPPQNLRAGQEITLVIREFDDGRVTADALKLSDGGIEASVSRAADGSYVAEGGAGTGGPTRYFRALASIQGSLYGTARAQDVPDAIIVRMMHTHSFDVDFQREIRAGDTFEVFYRTDDTSARGAPATLLYSSLTNGGKTRSYYRFEGDDGTTDFYDAEGRSGKKPLMRTPINGARISSGFGLRKHPILGYTKMHGGTDFAAQKGTPILAAGDGVVDFAGRNGGYGNYVRLKHKNGVKTAYAHMSRFAKGIRKGQSVRQGQIIGFVGSTGRSTGPHLHYEVHIKGKKKNPLTVKLAGSGRKLEGAELARFEAERDRIDEMRVNAAVTAKVAAARP